MYKIGFICVHNSCRSQMAQAICNLKYGDFFEAYSAGTHLKSAINQDAVTTIKENYGVDMNLTQYNKLIDELPELDIVITMGCNVNCPNLPSKYREDFGLDDPSGHEQLCFKLTAEIIDLKLMQLKQQIINKNIIID